MNIDQDFLEKVSRLSKIDLDSSETPAYQKNLSDIVSLFASLSDVNTDGIESYRPTTLSLQQLRKDGQSDSINIQALTSLSPYIDQQNHHIEVPLFVTKDSQLLGNEE